MIPQKMSSQTELEVEGIDLLTVNNIEVILRQDDFYKEITDAAAVASNRLVFGLPAQDAALLNYKKPVFIQVLYTDALGNPAHTVKATATVDEVIKDGIYGN